MLCHVIPPTLWTAVSLIVQGVKFISAPQARCRLQDDLNLALCGDMPMRKIAGTTAINIAVLRGAPKHLTAAHTGLAPCQLFGLSFATVVYSCCALGRAVDLSGTHDKRGLTCRACLDQCHDRPLFGAYCRALPAHVRLHVVRAVPSMGSGPRQTLHTVRCCTVPCCLRTEYDSLRLRLMMASISGSCVASSILLWRVRSRERR